MAGTIKADVIQLGDSGTADNNFFLKTNGDGSASLVRGNNPTGTNILTVSAAGKVNIESSVLQSATAVASTSGTSIDFTGIPSWARRITVIVSGLITSGTSNIRIQLGDNGGLDTSGYLGAGSNSGIGVVNFTSGFDSNLKHSATHVLHGSLILTNINANSWVIFGTLGRSDHPAFGTVSGSKALSNVLDRIRITTASGTNTFTDGSINIMWE